MAENLRAFGLFVFILNDYSAEKFVEATTSFRRTVLLLSARFDTHSDVIFSCVSDSRKLHCFENIEYYHLSIDFCIRCKYFGTN